jgi:type II secretory pathway pseudopilin PulG
LKGGKPVTKNAPSEGKEGLYMKKVVQSGSSPSECGFTLVEVLLSITLTTLAFVGILATYTTSLAVQKQIDERAHVLFFVQQTLEQVLAVDYTDLPISTTVEIFEDEIDGILIMTSTVSKVVDSAVHNQWVRFTDPTPTQHYKKVSIAAVWGPEGTPTDKMERIELTTYRVERENTVDFSERVSSQLPWN